MELLTLSDPPGHLVDAHGSRGFRIRHLSTLARASWATLSEGGVIGLHPATEDQLLVLLAGAVTVTGAEGRPAVLEPGRGALWSRGEVHGTTAQADSVVLLLEGNDLFERLSAASSGQADRWR